MAETYDTKKQQIIDQSKVIFAQLGYNKTTMDDIAEAVGMKKNSIYYYFENKEALFNNILELEIERLLEGEKKVLAGCKNSRQKIEELIKYALGMHSARNISVRSFTIKAFFEILSFSKSRINDFNATQIQQVSDILKEGVVNKEFKKHDSEKLAENILITINAIIAREYNRSNAKFVHEIDFSKANRTILGLLEFILDGITLKRN